MPFSNSIPPFWPYIYRLDILPISQPMVSSHTQSFLTEKTGILEKVHCSTITGRQREMHQKEKSERFKACEVDQPLLVLKMKGVTGQRMQVASEAENEHGCQPAWEWGPQSNKCLELTKFCQQPD